MKPLPKSFFDKPTVEVAKNLLGKVLFHRTAKGIIAGRIVETEAYLHMDEASHSFKGKTALNAMMFDSPGRAYIYFTYGMYHCFNIVTNKKDTGEAVLIRALEPILGIDLMKKNRKKENVKDLCSGPAKLFIALGMKKEQNGSSLISSKSELRLMQDDTLKRITIASAKRIGIKKAADKKLRFYIKGNEFVSRKYHDKKI